MPSNISTNFFTLPYPDEKNVTYAINGPIRRSSEEFVREFMDFTPISMRTLGVNLNNHIYNTMFRNSNECARLYSFFKDCDMIKNRVLTPFDVVCEVVNAKNDMRRGALRQGAAFVSGVIKIRDVFWFCVMEQFQHIGPDVVYFVAYHQPTDVAICLDFGYSMNFRNNNWNMITAMVSSTFGFTGMRNKFIQIEYHLNGCSQLAFSPNCGLSTRSVWCGSATSIKHEYKTRR